VGDLEEGVEMGVGEGEEVVVAAEVVNSSKDLKFIFNINISTIRNRLIKYKL
jgi:hypothetical protein